MKKDKVVLGLFILLLICFLAPMIPQKNLPLTAKADAPNWWDADWLYRKKLTLDTDAGAQPYSDYHINITVYRSSGTDADYKVYVGSKCESDYDDLRFVDWDNTTVLDYYIQSSDVNSAIVWIETDVPNAAGTETLWFYYGNSGASAYSNGEDTFLLFDDFDDGSLNTTKWNTGTGATWGGTVYEEDGSAILNMTTLRTVLYSEIDFAGDVALVFRAWFKDVRAMGLWINTTAGAPDGTKDCAYFKTETADGYTVENNGVGGTNAFAIVEQDWQILESRWDLSISGHCRAVVDGATRVTDVTDIPDSNPDMKPFFYIYNGDAAEYLKIGWAFVRKYAEPNDPNMSWGSEEPRERPPTIDASLVFACDSDRGSHNIGAYTNSKPTAKMVVQDLDGFTELDYVEFSLYDTGRSSEYWRVQYDEATDTVSEDADASNMIVITSSGSTVINSTTRTIWFIWYPTENHAEAADFDIKTFAVDDFGNNVTDWTENSYEGGEIRVDPEFTAAIYNLNDLSGTADRGDLDSFLRVSYSVTHRDFVDSWDTSLIDMWVNASFDFWEIDAPTYSALSQEDSLVKSNFIVSLDTYYLKIVKEGAGSNGANLLYTDFTDIYTSDKVTVTVTPPTYTHLSLGLNASGFHVTGAYQYDSSVYDGSYTWSSGSFSSATATSHYYNITAISGDTHDVTGFDGGLGAMIYWENTTYVWGDIWTKYTETQYYNHITLSNLAWSTSGVSVQDGATVSLLRNGTTMATTTTFSSIASFVVGFTPSWLFANYSVKIVYVSGSYNITTQVFIKSQRVSVPTMNTLYLDIFDIDFTDDYFYITWETNWHNATLTIWDNTSLIDYYTTEGISQIALSTTAGLHQLVILINGSSPQAQGTYNAAFPDNVKWEWRFLNYSVSLEATTMHFAYYMADGSAMLFHAFKTYINGYRLPPEKPWFTTTASTVNLTITDVWNNTVYQDTTLTVAEYVDIVTSSYWLTFTNQRDYAVNVTIQFNSRNWTVPDSLGHGEGFSLVIYTGNYTIWVWRVDNGELEPGFPKTKSVTTDWEVYTERTIPEGDRGGGGGGSAIGIYALWGAAIIITVLGGTVIYPEIRTKWRNA